MQILPVSHEPDEIKKRLEEQLSLLPEGAIKGLGKAVMSFTRWQVDEKEETVLKIKPDNGSKIEVNIPAEAMYIDAHPDSTAFQYKGKGYLIFHQ
ncbi:MAG: hypothetical protein AABW58_02940 [Nanoarchaeota archaeon]